MPKYKLIYFNARGRAETIRLLLKAGNMEFEDVRISGNWAEIKPTTPFGYLPVLDVDGGKLVLCESTAILRYIAKQAGLNGKDEYEKARTDMMAEVLIEVVYKVMGMGVEKDKEKKEENHKKFVTEFLPTFLPNILKQLKQNNGGSEVGFFVGTSLTYADVIAYYLFSTILSRRPDALDSAPPLKAFAQRIGDIPQIKDWLQTRPVTDN